MDEILDKDYIQEIEEKIPELNNKLKQIQEDKVETEKFIKTIGLTTLPFIYKNEYNMSIFSDKYSEDYARYKNRLYSNWREPDKGKRVLTEAASYILYYTYAGICLLVIALCIIFDIYKFFNINFISFAFIGCFIAELIAGIYSTWYYMVRPNIINKRQSKFKLKQLKKEEKLLLNELQIKSNLIEQYKLATIDPNKQFNKVKRRTSEELREIVKYTLKNIVPNINKDLSNKYNEILNKCNKLLDIANEDGRIVTEISKIYNIYINDINEILTKSNELNMDNVYVLLNNFESYIDRKLKKFDNISGILIERDINALNKAFMEED